MTLEKLIGIIVFVQLIAYEFRIRALEHEVEELNERSEN